MKKKPPTRLATHSPTHSAVGTNANSPNKNERKSVEIALGGLWNKRAEWTEKMYAVIARVL